MPLLSVEVLAALFFDSSLCCSLTLPFLLHIFIPLTSHTSSGSYSSFFLSFPFYFSLRQSLSAGRNLKNPSGCRLFASACSFVGCYLILLRHSSCFIWMWIFVKKHLYTVHSIQAVHKRNVQFLKQRRIQCTVKIPEKREGLTTLHTMSWWLWTTWWIQSIHYQSKLLIVLRNIQKSPLEKKKRFPAHLCLL